MNHAPHCSCIECESARVSPNRILPAIVSAEWWVMKVLVEGGAVVGKPDGDNWTKLPKKEREAILHGIANRSVVVVGDDICEPVEVYNDQDRAMTRALAEHERTGVSHKVTLNADLVSV